MYYLFHQAICLGVANATTFCFNLILIKQQYSVVGELELILRRYINVVYG
jgi:hypothetical protein